MCSKKEEFFNRDIRELAIRDKKIFDVLYANDIKTFGNFSNCTKADLMSLGLTKQQSNDLEIKGELEGLYLKNK